MFSGEFFGPGGSGQMALGFVIVRAFARAIDIEFQNVFPAPEFSGQQVAIFPILLNINQEGSSTRISTAQHINDFRDRVRAPFF